MENHVQMHLRIIQSVAMNLKVLLAGNFLFLFSALNQGVVRAGETSLPAHIPVAKIKDRFTPADPAAVKLGGVLGRYVGGVRNQFLLHTNIISTYLRPVEQHDDSFWQAEHIGK